MAAALSSYTSPTYGIEEQNIMRIKFIYAKVPKRVLHFLFKGSICDKPQDMPLLDYYESKGIPKAKFKNSLYCKQLQKIMNDSEGKSFDVSLLCSCFRKGSHGLAKENSDMWKTGNGSIESLITWVKNKRNDISHEELTFTKMQLIEEANQLREYLTEILNLGKQIYQIPEVRVSQELTNMDYDINRYLNDDLNAQDFEEYKKQLLFPEQSNYIHTKGNEEVRMQYSMKTGSAVSLLSYFIDVLVSTDDSCTEMALQDEATFRPDETVTYENILKCTIDNKKTGSIVLIEGISGAGKTTLVRKIKNDWISKQDENLKYFSSEDLLLYTECKNSAISSFEGLLRHLMPNTARNFKGEVLKYAALDQKILLILDGLDELNDASTLLFEEILQLKKDFGITVIATTRPEKVEYFKRCVKYHQIQTKHIKLLGIPLHQVRSFITRIYYDIASQHPSPQSIDGLLSYLQRTLNNLSSIWIIPYNSVSLTILWVYHYINADSISTAPDLYREIYKLHRVKLTDRLRDCRATHHLHDSERDKIIDSYLFTLAKESIIAISNNHISLMQESYQRLKDSCLHINVPIEEMIGAFLKKDLSGTITRYSYLHNGLQDFLAAYYIWAIISQSYQSYDTQKTIKAISDTLSQNDIPIPVSQDIIKYAGQKLRRVASSRCTANESKGYNAEETAEAVDALLTQNNVPEDLTWQICNFLRKRGSIRTQNAIGEDTQESSVHLAFQRQFQMTNEHYQDNLPQRNKMNKIRNILKEIHQLSAVDMSKYRKTFTLLLGMFYADNYRVTDCLKTELLTLLREAGMTNRLDWIPLFDMIKLDDLAVEFISRQEDILLGDVKITDSCLEAYLSILRVLEPPLKDASSVNISLNIMGKSPSLTELIEQINRNELPVSAINVHFYFENLVTDPALGKAINTVFQRCSVKRYIGPITAGMSLPSSIHRLSASVADLESYKCLLSFFNSCRHLGSFELCMSASISLTGMRALPGTTLPHLFLPDVVEGNDVKAAADVIHRLKPVGRKFHRIYFPRSKMTFHDLCDLILMLRGISIYGSVVFPTRCKPDNPGQEQWLAALARNHLHFSSGVEWGKSFGRDIDHW